MGLDDRDIDTAHETKSLGHEFTFDTDLIEKEIIRRELLDLAVMVAKRLRRHRLQGKTITLKVKYHDFKQITRSSSIKEHVDDSRRIYHKILELLEKTAAGEKPVRLLGISVSGLKPTDQTGQPVLFPKLQSDPKRQQINKALDTIQEKYGSTAIIPGRLLGEK